MTDFAEGMMKNQKIIEQQDKEVQEAYEKTGTYSVPVHKKRLWGFNL